jgi:hypothetical protein
VKKSKIKKSLYLLAACAILLPIAGCQKKRGGGFLSILTATVPKTAKTAAYGICADKKLGFIIFSETTGDGSASSS